MLNISIQHLRVVAAIYNEGSMTKAAESLFLTQSALSHHLKDLEQNLGVKVFERRNRKLWITQAGEKLLKTAETTRAAIDNLEKEIADLKNGNTGHIRISTECYTSYKWLPPFIKMFKETHPGSNVEIVMEATRRPLVYLNNGELDIAVTSRRKGDDLSHYKQLRSIPLFQDEQVAIISRNNSLSAKKKILPSDLQGQTLYVFDADDKDIDIINLVLKPQNLKPEKIVKLPMTEIIFEMVKADMGLTVLARWMVSPYMNDDVVMLPFISNFSKRTWHLITHKNQTAMQKKFCDFIKHQLQRSID